MFSTFFAFMETFLHLSSTNSTNEDAYRLACDGAVHGSVVLADSQTGGRGRLGRDWYSSPGAGLYCSVIIRPKLPPSLFPQLTLTAGLSLCQGIESLGIIGFGLKWPNDLYCMERKCGGILVESSPLHEAETKHFLVIGIGLNVNNEQKSFPDTIKDKSTSLFVETGRKWQITDIYRKVHSQLLKNVTLHEERGFSAILREWKKRDILFGREMQWVTTDKRLITGKGMGPDKEGRLIAQDRNGTFHEILSGDVTLAGKNEEKKNRR